MRALRYSVVLVVWLLVSGAVVGDVAAGAAAKPKSDPAWSAAGLLTAASVTAALGEPVAVVEDDGGFPASNGIAGHVSAARLLTQSGAELDVTLYSVSSPANARSVYTQFAGQVRSGAPIAGAGDRSVYADGQSVVQKGAQVLTVNWRPSAALEEQFDTVKGAGGDPTPTIAQSQVTAQKVASALGPAMKGTTATRSVVALPKGAVDPCSLSAKSLSRALKVKGVTTSYETGVGAPALTCAYSIPGGGSIEITTVTGAQLKASVAPTTVADKLAADQQSASKHYPGVVTSASGEGVQGFSVIDTDGGLVDLEVASSTHGEAVLSTLYQNPSNEKRDCEAFIAWMADQDRKFPHEAIQPLAFPPSQQMLDELTKLDKCRKLLGK